ncbi:MAG: thiamine biosynthesis protein ThiJ [Spirochaetes bacterium GWF1_51_8]|nr:MAG: thiamine biosynthesis protein ThiJ [Spirochaetes bacterium GWF1_51_8]
MPKVIVPLAEGFEEIEAVTIIDILRRAKIEVAVAGLKFGATAGSHGIAVTPDVRIEDVNSAEYDMIVLPGGQPGTKNLKGSHSVLSLVKEFYAKGKLVGAICAAPTVLHEAGILKDKKATSFPGYEPEMPDANYVSETVVWDGNIVTSRGPGTAAAFALSIVAKLGVRAEAEKLKNDMLYFCINL